MPFPIPDFLSTPISTEFFVPIPPPTAAFGQSIAQLIAFAPIIILIMLPFDPLSTESPVTFFISPIAVLVIKLIVP